MIRQILRSLGLVLGGTVAGALATPHSVSAADSGPSTRSAVLFEVTPAAVASVKRMTKEAHLNGPVALIVGVKADGFHTLDLTEEGLDPKTSLQFESNGITVRILRTDADALRGWSLDWGKDGDREGFVFKNSAGR